jgi:succinyl-CoA synthetase beta subunit
VDLFEHQAKALFADYGIPVPRGIVAHTVEEVFTCALSNTRPPRS